MKLEDIKKMSDEEFIEFARSFSVQEDIPIEEFFKQNKKTVNIMTVMPGITVGLIPYSILDNFTDDNLILGASFVLGSIIGMPIVKKIVKWLVVKVSDEAAIVNKNELIDLKKKLENLTEDEFSFLIGISKNEHVFGLHDKIKRIFDNDTKKFIDSLEPSYKDDNDDLGYSKNINKNN